MNSAQRNTWFNGRNKELVIKETAVPRPDQRLRDFLPIPLPHNVFLEACPQPTVVKSQSFRKMLEF
jgi:hypothetical protein